MEKTVKKKLESLAKILELIQTDMRSITNWHERIEFVQMAGVLGGDPLGWSLMASALMKNTPLKVKKINEILTESWWMGLCGRFDILKEFLFWFSENLESNYSLGFSIERSLSWGKGDKFRIYDAQPNEPTVLVKDVTFRKTLLMHGEIAPAKFVKKFILPPEFMVLVEALDGIPSESIRRCEYEKCIRLFVQTTKREKRFCSTRCQNTIAVRALRERKSKKGD